ncbi:MAG: DUF4259 domain-containing protein [Pseudomonadota bacterium]
MGTWSAGSFGNDTALDFVEDVEDFAKLRETLLKLSAVSGELDADTASIAIAACDLLAASIERPPGDLPDIPDLSGHDVSDDLLDKAKSLVAHVRSNSELAELWSEEDDEEWQEELDALVVRLTPSQPYVEPEKPQKPDLPDDFIGYCYICHGMVTERDGFHFEYRFASGIKIGNYPHRKCIKETISIDGLYWNPDGSPTEETRKKLLQAMGVEDDEI